MSRDGSCKVVVEWRTNEEIEKPCHVIHGVFSPWGCIHGPNILGAFGHSPTIYGMFICGMSDHDLATYSVSNHGSATHGLSGSSRRCSSVCGGCLDVYDLPMTKIWILSLLVLLSTNWVLMENTLLYFLWTGYFLRW